MADWPKVVYKEEGMREGMQIEDAEISVDDKVEFAGRPVRHRA